MQPLFHDSLARALERHPSLEIVDQIDDVAHLAPALQRTSADVALVDESLLPPGALPPSAARLILLAGEPEPRRAFEAIEDGAAGYLSRDLEADVLCDAISRVAAGETVIDPAVQTGVAREVRLRADDGRPMLSPREQEILGLIAQGMTAPDIGRRLHLSTATVKTHILHLYEKLDVGERAEAVAEAMRQGLIE